MWIEFIEDFDFQYFKKCCLDSLKLIIRSWSIVDKFFVVGPPGVLEIQFKILWIFVVSKTCILVTTCIKDHTFLGGGVCSVKTQVSNAQIAYSHLLIRNNHKDSVMLTLTRFYAHHCPGSSCNELGSGH